MRTFPSGCNYFAKFFKMASRVSVHGHPVGLCHCWSANLEADHMPTHVCSYPLYTISIILYFCIILYCNTARGDLKPQSKALPFDPHTHLFYNIKIESRSLSGNFPSLFSFSQCVPHLSTKPHKHDVLYCSC